MILTSTTETMTFKVPWRADDPKAPTFHLRAGSVIERGQMEAELSGKYRAGRVPGFAVLAAARDGVQTLLADDPGLDRALSVLDAQAQGEEASLSDEDKKFLGDIHKVLGEFWPDYVELNEQAERRRELAPLIAIRRFCTDIEGEGITFARGKDGLVSDATLAALDSMEVFIAGNRAFNLQYGIGADAEKNLVPPSDADVTPPNLSAGDTSRAAGKSAATSGKKTPGSRSPRKPGR
jgi:hypothetical protein